MINKKNDRQKRIIFLRRQLAKTNSLVKCFGAYGRFNNPGYYKEEKNENRISG